MTRPAAYLRKSKDTATKADHLAILMDAVHADGHNGDTVVYDDWARSGDIAKIAKRAAWRDLCAAIERGDHDVVYMNDLDRGGRSIEEWARFMRVARDRGVRVVAGGVDWASPGRKLEFHIRASFAEEELDRAKARSARTKQIRARRGDAVVGGHAAPYGSMWARAGDVGMVTDEHPDPRRIVVVPNADEPAEPLLAAVADTRGNVLQACKLLNDRGVPSRGRKGWEPRTLSRALDARGVARGRRGARDGSRRRMPSDAPLSRLVECHCGALMTPVRDPRNGEWLSLYCGRGHKAGAASHGRYVARSRHVVEFLRDRLYGWDQVRAVRATDDDTEQRRAHLAEDRRRLGIAYTARAIDDAEFVSQVAAIDAELADLETDGGEAVGDLEHAGRMVEFDQGDARLGEDLRRVVDRVVLDESMMPADLVMRRTRVGPVDGKAWKRRLS